MIGLKRFLFVFLTLALCFLSENAQAIGLWVLRSNLLAEEFTTSIAEQMPEVGSSAGLTQFDSQGMVLRVGENDASKKFNASWKKKLTQLASREKDPDLRLDIQILLSAVTRAEESDALEVKLGFVPFYPYTKFILTSIKGLLDPAQDPSRREAAIARFKQYMRGTSSTLPLSKAYMRQTQYLAKKYGARARYPLKNEVTHYLEQWPSHIEALGKAFEKSGVQGWTEDFADFKKQAGEYEAFVKKDILPRAHPDFKMPRELYAWTLKARGILSTPESLIAEGHRSYDVSMSRWKKLAASIAQRRGLKSSDPVHVLFELKKEKVFQEKQLLEHYQNWGLKLSTSLSSHDLIRVPDTQVPFKIIKDKEITSEPYPHLEFPNLAFNLGEAPEFQLPAFNSAEDALEDFSYVAAVPVIVAHEGRPGHELHADAMIKKGVSIIRARHVFNSVNIEGWAFYAEETALPFMPEESQFAQLQMRLWREARAFLDPELHLGKTTPTQAKDLFVKTLGLSEKIVDIEIERMTYDDPAQAPAYFYAFQKLSKTKADLQKKLGKQLTERCFNDGVLSLGLIPVDKIYDEFLRQVRCSKPAPPMGEVG